MTFRLEAVRRLTRLAFGLIPLFSAACDDEFNQEWSAVPDTVQLYSLSRAELVGRPSAFDVVDRVPLAVENPGATGRWDFALVDQGNDLAFMPAGGFAGLNSRAAIATTSAASLDAVREAPADTSAFKRTAVPMRVGSIYILRSRRESCGFGVGVRYAKMEPLEINKAAGTMRFRVIVNPYCNDRRLIPPDED